MNSSAQDGSGFNGGEWTLVRGDGTLSGVVTGGRDFVREFGEVFYLDLVTTTGTGTLEHAKGKLFFWTCDNGGGLRLTPKLNYSRCQTQ